MIQLKNKSELERMKKACQISAQALVVAGEHIRAGMTIILSSVRGLSHPSWDTAASPGRPVFR